MLQNVTLRHLTRALSKAAWAYLFASSCGGAHAQTSAIVVSDMVNNRVLIYNAPIHTNEPPSVVLGQADFVHGKVNRGGAETANTLNLPLVLAKDPEHNLYVADTDNCRIVRFRPPFTNGMNADLIIELAEPGKGT
jgi:hypothetical protein